jgi:hypothetical protein
MPKTATRDYVEERVNGKGFILLNFYKSRDGRAVKVVVQDESGYKVDTWLKTLMQGRFCMVGTTNPYALENISLWLKLHDKNFQLCKDNKYNGKDKKLKFYHPVCDDFFFATWADISQNKGCGVCHGLQVGERHSLAQKQPELLKQWSPNNTISPYEIAQSSNIKVYWICKNCGYGLNNEWFVSPNARTASGFHDCPKCASSWGNRKISYILSNKNIENFPEHRFPNCKDINVLPFDFYLPYYNICIEYQGEQHYRVLRNDMFGGIKEFNIRKNMI